MTRSRPSVALRYSHSCFENIAYRLRPSSKKMFRRKFTFPALSRAPVYSAKACMSASESLYHGPVSASTAGPASIVIGPRMLLIFHLYGLFIEDGISSLGIMFHSVLSVLLSPLKLRVNVYDVH